MASSNDSTRREFFEIWVSALTLDREGRIWWNNFGFDQRSGNISDSDYEFIVQLIEGLRESPATLASAVEIFDRLSVEHGSAVNMRGARRPAQPVAYSRVISAKDCADFHIDWDRLGYEEDEQTDQFLWDRLGTFVTNDHYIGSLRTGRPFFWVTTKSDIENRRAELDPHPTGNGNEMLAQDVRDALGLIDILEGTKLLEMTIPPSKVVGRKVCAPTSLDAGIPGVPFVPSSDASGFGWTLNLTSGKPGLHEVLIEALSFDSSYPSLEKIGIVRSACPAIDLAKLETESEERLSRL